MNSDLHEAIKYCKILITHDNCADGTASAMMAVAAFPGLKVLFMQYGTEEHQNLNPAPGMVFVDFTPYRSRAQEFVEAGTVVLDHHEGAKDIVEMFGALGVYADKPGVSGALLAYEYMLEPFAPQGCPLPSALKLAQMVGIRDTWQKDDPEWGEALAYTAAIHGLTREDLLDEAADGAPHLSTDDLQVGRTLVRDRVARVASVSLVRTDRQSSLGGHVVHCFNDDGSGALISDVAERCRRLESARGTPDFIKIVCVGFRYCEGPYGTTAVRFSIRSGAGFNSAEFCKKYAGGGHARAAGFAVPADVVGVDPFGYISQQIENAMEHSNVAD